MRRRVGRHLLTTGSLGIFIVGTKDDPENYKKVLDCFVEFNQSWAKSAPVVALSVAKLKFEHNGEMNRHAFHDVGAATATLTIQAEALGLAVHQMGGILPEKAREIFGIPEGYEAVAGIAIGYPGEAHTLPDHLKEPEVAPRERKALDSFVFYGKVGEGFADCWREGVTGLLPVRGALNADARRCGAASSAPTVAARGRRGADGMWTARFLAGRFPAGIGICLFCLCRRLRTARRIRRRLPGRGLRCRRFWLVAAWCC